MFSDFIFKRCAFLHRLGGSIIDDGMARQRRIIIADRSELAANMYRLLLEPLEAELVIRKRFEEARPHFFRREKCDMAIINSNIFGKKFDDIVQGMLEAIPVGAVPKIFICKENEISGSHGKMLASVKKSWFLHKPFHPDELFELVGRLLP